MIKKQIELIKSDFESSKMRSDLGVAAINKLVAQLIIKLKAVRDCGGSTPHDYQYRVNEIIKDLDEIDLTK